MRRADRGRPEPLPGPVVIQSFEIGNLQRLNRITDVRLVQLINCTGAPWDLVAAGDPRTYADLATPRGCAGSPGTPTRSGSART